MADKPSRLNAEWFWTDRWTNSRGHTLPMEARGLYREMLTQAARLGGALPVDVQTLCRIVHATADEWARSWPIIEALWIRTSDGQLIAAETFGDVVPLPGKHQHYPPRPYISSDVREAVFARDGARCLVCGSVERLELDHVVAFSRGGESTMDNLQTLCKTCNIRKGAR